MPDLRLPDPCPGRSPEGYRCCLGRGPHDRCHCVITTYPMPGWPEREVVTWPRVPLAVDNTNEENKR